jgi:hypothetical protein
MERAARYHGAIVRSAGQFAKIAAGRVREQPNNGTIADAAVSEQVNEAIVGSYDGPRQLAENALELQSRAISRRKNQRRRLRRERNCIAQYGKHIEARSEAIHVTAIHSNLYTSQALTHQYSTLRS